MKTTSIAAVTLAAFVLAACETILPENRNPLVGQEWRLSEIQRPSQPTVSIPRNRQASHTMLLSIDGTARYRLDCNQGNGSWQGQLPMNGGGQLTIGDIAATRALCPPPSYGEEMAAALPLASSYRLSPNGERLEIMTRTGVYVFNAR